MLPLQAGVDRILETRRVSGSLQELPMTYTASRRYDGRVVSPGLASQNVKYILGIPEIHFGPGPSVTARLLAITHISNCTNTRLASTGVAAAWVARAARATAKALTMNCILVCRSVENDY